MTRRGNRAFTAIFGLIFLLGIVGVGFAAVQIYQLRTSAGNQVLPALAPLVPTESSQVQSASSQVQSASSQVQSASPQVRSTSQQATKTPATRVVAYSPYPKVGDVIGTISLPSLKEKIPIIEGTDESELKRGVGHYVRSVLPGIVDNSVLAGHRDSVFSQLGKLALGDPLVVRTAAGQFTYMVSKLRIVMADDRTVIVPTSSAVLTLSTCYPFRYIGNAPKRYIVTADLVQTELAKY